MIRGVAFLHGDKNSATSGTDFSSSSQGAFDGCAVIRDLHNPGREKNRIVRGSGPHHFDGVLRGDRAGRPSLACAFHQMIGGCPIAMAIKQRPDDPAVQHSVERFVFFLRLPLGDDFGACSRFIGVPHETTNVQPIGI